jgi:hypothetical protein
MAPAGEVAQIIAFDKENFEGDQPHIFGDMSRLGRWDNSMSSIVI